MKTIASLVVAVLAATLLSLGLVGSAQATHGYGPHLRTSSSVSAADSTIRRGQRAVTYFRLTAGNRSPAARVSYSIVKRSGAVVGSATRRYDGGRMTFRSPRLRKGRYVVTVRANPTNDRYRNSSDSHGVRVRR